MVGRQAELDLVVAALASGAAGVVLAGPAGVGKTRLAREVVQQLADDAWETESLRGSDAASSVPFGALLPLLPHHVDPGTGAETYRRIFEAVSDRARDGRLLIFLDDVHLVDPASAMLAQDLARRTLSRSILTVRSGVPAQDVIESLWTDGTFLRVDLQNLSERESSSMIETMLSGAVASSVTQGIWDLARGNPLFTRELVLDGLTGAQLRQIDGVWLWPDRLEPGPRLNDLLLRRLEPLAPSIREAIDLVALDDRVSLSDACTIVPPEAITSAEIAGFIVVEHDGRRRQLRLVHPLYAEVARSAMPTSTRDRITAALVDRLEASGLRRGHDVVRLVSGRLDLAQPVDPDLAARAAREMNSVDDDGAVRFARAAVDNGGGPKAEIALAWSLLWLGWCDEAVQRAQAALSAGLDGAGSAAAITILFIDRLVIHGDVVAAERLLVDAETSGQAAAPRLLLLRIVLCLARSDMNGAAALFEELESVDGSRTDALSASGEVAAALAQRGGFAAAFTMTEPYVEFAVEGARRGAVVPASALAARVAATSMRDGPLAARPHLELLDQMTRQGLDAAIFDGLMWHSRLALDQGLVGDGRRFAVELAERCERRFAGPFEALATLLIAEAAVVAGDAAGASELLGRMSNIEPADPVLFGSHGRVSALVAAAHGEVSRADALAVETSDVLADHGLVVLEMRVLHDRVRSGTRGDMLRRLTRCAERIDGAVAGAVLAYAVGVSSSDATRLVRACDEFESIGLVPDAVDAARAAATALGARGDRRAAASLRIRTEELLRRCPGLRPSSAVEVQAPTPLTRRETEIILLTSRGLTNREIAQRLVVGVRTVEGHQQRAYVKLGVTSRAELRRRLGPENT